MSESNRRNPSLLRVCTPQGYLWTIAGCDQDVYQQQKMCNSSSKVQTTRLHIASQNAKYFTVYRISMAALYILTYCMSPHPTRLFNSLKTCSNNNANFQFKDLLTIVTEPLWPCTGRSTETAACNSSFQAATWQMQQQLQENYPILSL